MGTNDSLVAMQIQQQQLLEDATKQDEIAKNSDPDSQAYKDAVQKAADCRDEAEKLGNEISNRIKVVETAIKMIDVGATYRNDDDPIWQTLPTLYRSDCSGSFWYCLDSNRVKILRLTAEGYYNKGDKLASSSDLKPGDIITWYSDTPVNGEHWTHMQVYLGEIKLKDGTVIHDAVLNAPGYKNVNNKALGGKELYITSLATYTSWVIPKNFSKKEYVDVISKL